MPVRSNALDGRLKIKRVTWRLHCLRFEYKENVDSPFRDAFSGKPCISIWKSSKVLNSSWPLEKDELNALLLHTTISRTKLQYLNQVGFCNSLCEEPPEIWIQRKSRLSIPTSSSKMVTSSPSSGGGRDIRLSPHRNHSCVKAAPHPHSCTVPHGDQLFFPTAVQIKKHKKRK